MRLLYLPIVSVTRYFFAGKPISSYPSKANSTALSKPSWVMPAILEPVRCFLRSIQNIGGAAGFSFAVFVRLKCGLLVPEESDRRRFSRPLSLAACRRRTISSFSRLVHTLDSRAERLIFKFVYDGGNHPGVKCHAVLSLS